MLLNFPKGLCHCSPGGGPIHCAEGSSQGALAGRRPPGCHWGLGLQGEAGVPGQALCACGWWECVERMSGSVCVATQSVHGRACWPSARLLSEGSRVHHVCPSVAVAASSRLGAASTRVYRPCKLHGLVSTAPCHPWGLTPLLPRFVGAGVPSSLRSRAVPCKHSGHFS